MISFVVAERTSENAETAKAKNFLRQPRKKRIKEKERRLKKEKNRNNRQVVTKMCVC